MRPGPAVLAARAAALYERPLGADRYRRPTLEVAVDLLGRSLVRRAGRSYRVARIVETEAYRTDDRASHSRLGPTLRNRAMFGPPGTLYVYRIHQVHCANAVTGAGEAVLLRAAEPISGFGGSPRGPGRLCRALGIGPAQNLTNLVDGPVRISAERVAPERVERGVRVGIRLDAHRRWRFAVAGSEWVSPPRLGRGLL